MVSALIEMTSTYSSRVIHRKLQSRQVRGESYVRDDIPLQTAGLVGREPVRLLLANVKDLITISQALRG